MTAILMLVFGSASVLASPESETAQPRFEAKEHYRFDLGGESGQYTDWERTDLSGFDGLTTTINIERTFGKPGDKFASSARLNLFGPGTGKDRPMLSFIAIANRKDGHIDMLLMRSKDDAPHDGFDAKLAVGKPFELTLLRTEPGKLRVTIDKANYEVPCDFEVKALSVLGTGADVKFEPFNLLRRVTP